MVLYHSLYPVMQSCRVHGLFDQRENFKNDSVLKKAECFFLFLNYLLMCALKKWQTRDIKIDK